MNIPWSVTTVRLVAAASASILCLLLASCSGGGSAAESHDQQQPSTSLPNSPVFRSEVGFIAGSIGESGYRDGVGSAARFNFKSGSAMATDSNGNLYMVDVGNYVIRKVTPGGVVSTVAGTPGVQGLSDGPPNSAKFSFSSTPLITVDPSGNIYLMDGGVSNPSYGSSWSWGIRKIDTAGQVTTIAGTFRPFERAAYETLPETGALAREVAFPYFDDLVADAAGNVYAVEAAINPMRPNLIKIAANGTVTKTALPTTQAWIDGGWLERAYRLGFDSEGNLLVQYSQEFGAIKINQAGETCVVPLPAGDGYISLLPDRQGNRYRKEVFPADEQVPLTEKIIRITKVDSTGASSILAEGKLFDARGSRTDLGRFIDGLPNTPAVDQTGNLLSASHDMVFKLSPSGAVSVLAGAGLESGHVDGIGSEARFNSILSAMTTDVLGNLYVVDGLAIRKITPAGVVSTIAGNPLIAGVVNGKASDALFHSPRGVTIDAEGNLYVTDASRIVGTVDYRHHSSIRKITPSGEVSTLAGPTSIGSGSVGYADGIGSAARFINPGAIVADKAGNLYVADGSCTIRKVSQDGAVTTFAGKACGSTDNFPSADGIGSAAQFGTITALAIDQAGILYALDRSTRTFTVRKVSPGGVVTTMAGGEFGNVDAKGEQARFGRSDGSYGYGDGRLTLDHAGNLYVSDTENKSIRRVTPQGDVTTIATNVVSTSYGNSYGPSGIAFVAPNTLAIGLSGRLVKLTAQ